MTPEEPEHFRPVPHRLVRTDAPLAAKSFFLSAHAGAIVGRTFPEARMFLRDLSEHATQPQFIYRHRWGPGDLVIWDNRTTMHRGRRNEVRDVRRTTLAGRRRGCDERPLRATFPERTSSVAAQLVTKVKDLRRRVWGRLGVGSGRGHGSRGCYR
jgi:alpha-ketoglutarate-dependent 2,4-dichlorophenoxyacetate dioxygenase